MAHFGYLRNNFHLHATKYDRAYVVAALKNERIVGIQSQLSPTTVKAMDALILKHNARHHRENINRWVTGKYEYIIVAYAEGVF